MVKYLTLTKIIVKKLLTTFFINLFSKKKKIINKEILIKK